MERVERELKCPRCLYEWTSRKAEPKECPHCKKRLDWELGDYRLDSSKDYLQSKDEGI